jgi:hypothetical protein
MSLFRYFPEERYARDFIRKGVLRFGSLAYYRGIEDGGIRGDPKDGALHYAPHGGLEITMIADGRKLTGGSFTTKAENMFIYCMSGDLSSERSKEFGAFCVEIMDPDAIVRRLKARANPTSKLDYTSVQMGQVSYRPVDQIPGTDWAFPERVVLMKPPEFASQNETRIVLPLKVSADSVDSHVAVTIGDLTSLTALHVLK